MKKLLLLTQILMGIVAITFLGVAFSSLFIGEPFVERLIDFLVLLSPGLMIVFVMIFFRKYYRISGLFYIGLAVIYFFFLRPYMDFSEGWLIILTFVLPLIFAGVIHMTYNDKSKVNI
jgi:hypothetical protein